MSDPLGIGPIFGPDPTRDAEEADRGGRELVALLERAPTPPRTLRVLVTIRHDADVTDAAMLEGLREVLRRDVERWAGVSVEMVADEPKGAA